MTRFLKLILGALLLSTAAHADTGKKTASAGDTVIVHMQTSKGEIVLELDRRKAPVTVNNFVEYANAGFYDGTLFHRVIPGFMIQGGGFEPGMVKKPTHAPIKNESRNGLHNTVGTIAMARTRNADSATSQFFINTGNNAALDYPSQGGYCVFGKVIKGMDVVKAIEKTPRGKRGMYGDVPKEDIVIEKVTVEQPVPAPAANETSK
ncbi:peptidyl-prolyl cis-trans isomerase A (cyclophilin A)/peptidyl-prolyl cis-trans isomerase B (cyclophilin B) [Thiogranum longum]|uniref:Peptidyl-prolyl cis-trans isomerase n=1 Tax=Thiogranum longum TaxID=1537524 RepID=A0A4R1HC73_9GAMM|nr:peptidylprolyl isomerase [Thiogranum longum]TCK17790.1 peptidyl-prolyl cis-trans isomerase A (cyclophilin A)/peptidyl-prolyl cis-trans isomerase B (cyclophilin B) [Thiogranum longum]